jgi:hypothetical protein
MKTGRGDRRQRHVALVASTPGGVTEFDRSDAELDTAPIPALSLLRLSVPARLLMVAAAAALLWAAVFWALA